MMDLVEQKDGQGEWKIPRNKRQIGEPGAGTRVSIEDYVYTYLHQLAEANLTCMKTAVLLGHAEEENGIFVQGALELEMGQELRGWFSNEHWRTVFQEIREWFDGMDVVGWFLSNPGFPPVMTDETKTLHLRNFSGSRYIFFQLDVLDGEETLYAGTAAGPSPLTGYYVYYERNDPMQAYRNQQRGGAGIEQENPGRDTAAARFRSVMQEKREQNSQKKTLAFLYTASAFLVMVILVIGITMLNNYDRMVNMEDALYQLSENMGGEELEEAAEEENLQALEEAQEAAAVPAEEQPADSGEEGQGAEAPEASEAPDAGEEAAESDAAEEAAETAPAKEAPEETEEAMSQAAQEPESYQVQAGDTLLEICRARYGDEHMVSRICELNQLEDGDKIYEGQVILLP